MNIAVAAEYVLTTFVFKLNLVTLLTNADQNVVFSTIVYQEKKSGNLANFDPKDKIRISL